jgi:hypothetical protein
MHQRPRLRPVVGDTKPRPPHLNQPSFTKADRRLERIKARMDDAAIEASLLEIERVAKDRIRQIEAEQKRLDAAFEAEMRALDEKGEP